MYFTYVQFEITTLQDGVVFMVEAQQQTFFSKPNFPSCPTLTAGGSMGSVDRSAHLCAGEGRASASGGCNGDSGGPLACEMGGKWFLHGAVSFGMRNCPTTHYTVFTRVASYNSWILEKIGS